MTGSLAILTPAILAGFTSPIQVGTTPLSLLWSLPLILVVAAVYKAVKLRDVGVVKFASEVAVLFASIAVFMLIAAVSLHIIVRLIPS